MLKIRLIDKQITIKTIFLFIILKNKFREILKYFAKYYDLKSKFNKISRFHINKILKRI